MSTHSPPLVVGVLGHHGHGKSTLAVALLRRLAYRTGATITPPAIHVNGAVDNYPHPFWYRCASPRSTRLLVDCPHPSSDWLPAVLPALDGAIFVVAADRGIELHTRWLLFLARQAGARSMVVFLGHMDRVSEAQADEVELNVRRLMHALELPGDDTPIVRGDALDALRGDGCDEVSWALDQLDAAVQSGMCARPSDEVAPFLLPVGRRIWVPGQQVTVLTASERRYRIFGRVAQGRVRVGDEVELVTPTQSGVRRVSELVAFGETIREARPGDAISMALAAPEGGPLDLVADPGSVVAAAGLVRFHSRFRARLTAYEWPSASKQALHSGTTCGFVIGTASSRGQIELPKGRALRTGEPVAAVVTLARACHLAPGQSFALRHHSGILAAGDILEVLDCPADSS